ncbi:conserved protein of unknown function [Hyphomicrobium sp. MC1]|nr:conserved protein of unknown function [Hyphomicrobium sp. MC1]
MMQQQELAGAGLRGPFQLASDAIEEELVDRCPGTYALGFVDHLGRFAITYVGSAGEDLKSKLKAHIGTATQFKFRHFADERQAFEKECEIFHKFMPNGNILHPSRPRGTDWTCPKCRR